MDDTRIRRFRRAGALLGSLGLTLVVVGGLGLALDGDGGASATKAQSNRETAAATGTTAPARATGTTPVPTTAPVGTRAVAFFADWANALRTGDATFLYERLHPAVVDRYGDTACRAYVGAIQRPLAATEVLGTDPATAAWSWETDGRSTEIPDALGLRLRRTEDGSTYTESDVHVALVDGEVRWFTDCGTPREA